MRAGVKTGSKWPSQKGRTIHAVSCPAITILPFVTVLTKGGPSRVSQRTKAFTRQDLVGAVLLILGFPGLGYFQPSFQTARLHLEASACSQIFVVVCCVLAFLLSGRLELK